MQLNVIFMGIELTRVYTELTLTPQTLLKKMSSLSPSLTSPLSQTVIIPLLFTINI